MAEYNRWQNDSLLTISEKLKPGELEEDKRLFFGSMAKTWNHIVMMDLSWLDRFHSRPVQKTNFQEEQFSGLSELKILRTELDSTILNWVQTITKEWLAEDLKFYSYMYKREITLPKWLLLTHFFNHQTHHRSQISTGLLQSGLDYGVTDIPWNPFYPKGR
nr:DinB family protein [Leptospira sarikeiensis]